MADIPKCFDLMLAAWNERDLENIRGHLEQAVSEDVVFADPANYIEGIDAFEKMIRAFRKNIPEARAERASGFNTHNNRYRYKWMIYNGDQPMLAGMDVTQVNDAGKAIRIDGFFGGIPDA